MTQDEKQMRLLNKCWESARMGYGTQNGLLYESFSEWYQELTESDMPSFFGEMTLSQFITATQFSRDKLPTKEQVDAEIERYAITSDDLIADIYGYFLY